MNKAQFIAALAPHFGDSKKEAARAVDVVFDTIVRNISKTFTLQLIRKVCMCVLLMKRFV
jgi:nucleoid DNA-binding protein